MVRLAVMTFLLVAWPCVSSAQYVKWEPSFLPISIEWDSKQGLNVELSGKIETPLGVISYGSGSLNRLGEKTIQVIRGDSTSVYSYVQGGFLQTKALPLNAIARTEENGSVVIDMRDNALRNDFQPINSSPVPTFSEVFREYLQEKSVQVSMLGNDQHRESCLPIYGIVSFSWKEDDTSVRYSGTLRMNGCKGVLVVTRPIGTTGIRLVTEQQMVNVQIDSEEILLLGHDLRLATSRQELDDDAAYTIRLFKDHRGKWGGCVVPHGELECKYTLDVNPTNRNP